MTNYTLFIFILLFSLFFLLSSCDEEKESSQIKPTEPTKASVLDNCGDGICEAVEAKRGSCPEDCDGETSETSPLSPSKPASSQEISDEEIADIVYNHDTYSYASVEKEEAWTTAVSSTEKGSEEISVNGISVLRTDYSMKNPSSGALLDVSIYAPADASSSNTYPGVILVPGGTGGKSNFEESYEKGTAGPSIAEKFASEGFIVLIFSPDGRGQSTGTEDYNGYTQQDGLYELYRFLKQYGGVDTSTLGFVSYSYGVALVSGMLGRYQPEVTFFIEWEGPVNRYWVSVQCSNAGAVQSGMTCNDESYWREREAMRFVPYFSVDYFIIVQRADDHAQDTHGHAVEMNNYAIQYLDWVRVNGPENDINQEYREETLPLLDRTYQDDILEYMTELSE